MCLAIPGEILDIKEQTALMREGTVRFGGVSRSVNLAYTPEAQVGDFVIVHAGFAISRLNREEAERSLALLEDVKD